MTTTTGQWPKQIPYIIASEACERFSFYGMRNILTPFLMTALLLSVPEHLRAGEAKDVFHSFVIGVYFFPLLGGWIGDRLFGKYNTILWLSLLYCVGHAFLAIFEDSKTGFYTGLFLIALGSGGIKPLVSSFMGDQFDQSNKSLAQKAFDMFYFTINFGSFFASLSMPLLLKHFGAAVAFGIPGVLMFIATVFFWAGRHRYVHMPPEPKNPNGFLPVIKTALLSPGANRFGLALALMGTVLAVIALGFMPSLGLVTSLCLALVLLMGFVGSGASMQLDRARARHGDEAVEGVRAVMRILVLFALVTPFWSLFDQKASTWILQANEMTKPEWFEPAMMQALNPLLVMILIPFNNFVLYPTLERWGFRLTALGKMASGIAFSGLSWVVIGSIQLMMDGGSAVSIVWQVLPYALLTFGEVLVSATGLEFAYSQAPKTMKGTIMSFWTLSVTVGNLWVLLANASVKGQGMTDWIAGTGLSVTAFQMFFFAGFALVAAAVFALYARNYRMQDHYREAAQVSAV
ncbi:oligopeptide:H+ symporter [Shewanella amazonensis]|uniref:Proton/peptide symporter family protein n=1 Tax=Shewanella amazonensis (strain ATCC BAA-1098 / SB2B) TaxID=326297 RepID=A1S8A9_SHEAM|nr:oligopeptide:H+ symporter [Shewanella amazonensis]ABM00616.1 proton/peptide symporter family protein [Shewanella amazonensis SB2B]